MCAFVLTPRASQDLSEIWEYLATENIHAADRVLDRLEATILGISRAPALGHFREDLADKRHRFRLVYSYLIVYRWEPAPVQIVRVLHASRDVQALLSFGRIVSPL